MTVVPGGVVLKYTWERRPGQGDYYTVENMTPWAGIERAVSNPLIYAMSDLKEQKYQYEEMQRAAHNG